MTIEENLKLTILGKYKSIRAFSQELQIPYSTIDNIFKRGIYGTSISTMSKICNALNIDALALSNGEIRPIIHLEHNLTPEEANHINSYRMLDTYGKLAVDSILNIEIQRINNINQDVTAFADNEYSKLSLVGRNGTMPTKIDKAKVIKALQKDNKNKKPIPPDMF